MPLRALLLNQPLSSQLKSSLSRLPLFLRLRDEIAVTAMSSSIQSAAQRFGLQEDLVMETIRDFVSEVERGRRYRLGRTRTFSLPGALLLQSLLPSPLSPNLQICPSAVKSNPSSPSAKVQTRANTHKKPTSPFTSSSAGRKKSTKSSSKTNTQTT